MGARAPNFKIWKISWPLAVFGGFCAQQWRQHSGRPTLIKMLLCVGIILYLNHLPYIMALDKVLYCRHICLHGIFGMFCSVLVTPILDVTSADAWWIFWLTPSWRELQLLLDKLHSIANQLDMICNKTVCMIFNPKRRCNIMVVYHFPSFQIFWLIMLR